MQALLRDALDAAPEGPIRIVSMCAGQGRDVIEVVASHARRGDVLARLVELDTRNVAYARAAAARHGLDRIEIVEADASVTDAYVAAVPAGIVPAEIVPAEIVMVCGVFGNVSDHDVRATILRLPEFCAPAATVIWTRHRLEPDLTPAILGWFAEADFEMLAVEAPQASNWVGVGAHRFGGSPRSLMPGQRVFNFVRDPGDPPK